MILQVGDLQILGKEGQEPGKEPWWSGVDAGIRVSVEGAWMDVPGRKLGSMVSIWVITYLSSWWFQPI